MPFIVVKGRHSLWWWIWLGGKGGNREGQNHQQAPSTKCTSSFHFSQSMSTFVLVIFDSSPFSPQNLQHANCLEYQVSSIKCHWRINRTSLTIMMPRRLNKPVFEYRSSILWPRMTLGSMTQNVRMAPKWHKASWCFLLHFLLVFVVLASLPSRECDRNVEHCGTGTCLHQKTQHLLSMRSKKESEKEIGHWISEIGANYVWM